jgi:hypothetical protein
VSIRRAGEPAALLDCIRALVPIQATACQESAHHCFDNSQACKFNLPVQIRARRAAAGKLIPSGINWLFNDR